MTISVPKFGISYTAVPKVACTSIKNLFFYLENDRWFQESVRNGNKFHIHNYYVSGSFSPLPLSENSGFWKSTVVRDPLKRFLSCFSNRVLHYRELDEKHIPQEKIALGASPNPDLEEFVEKLELYREVSYSIKHHTNPHTFFLGRDSKHFDRIFQMSEIPDFEGELRERTGKTFAMPHEQRGGPKLSIDELSANAAEKLRKFYESDYSAFDFE